MTTAEKLLALAALEPGWNFGNGENIGPAAILAALRIEQAFHRFGYTATDAFPDDDGGVRVTGYWAGSFTACDINKQANQYVVWLEDGDHSEGLYEGGSLDAAIASIPRHDPQPISAKPPISAIADYKRQPWPWMISSGSYTFDTSTLDLVVSRAQRSSRIRAFPFSSKNVPRGLPPQPANTSTGSIRP